MRSIPLEVSAEIVGTKRHKTGNSLPQLMPILDTSQPSKDVIMVNTQTTAWKCNSWIYQVQNVLSGKVMSVAVCCCCRLTLWKRDVEVITFAGVMWRWSTNYSTNKTMWTPTLHYPCEFFRITTAWLYELHLHWFHFSFHFQFFKCFSIVKELLANESLHPGQPQIALCFGFWTGKQAQTGIPTIPSSSKGSRPESTDHC